MGKLLLSKKKRQMRDKKKNPISVHIIKYKVQCQAEKSFAV